MAKRVSDGVELIKPLAGMDRGGWWRVQGRCQSKLKPEKAFISAIGRTADDE
jgi:hypothetical protein